MTRLPSIAISGCIEVLSTIDDGFLLTFSAVLLILHISNALSGGIVGVVTINIAKNCRKCKQNPSGAPSEGFYFVNNTVLLLE